MIIMLRFVLGLSALFVLLMSTISPLRAATYQIPGPVYATLQLAAPNLAPGDIVEVQGNATYPGGIVFNNNGTPANPIIIRGITVNGNRPRLNGGGDVVKLDGDNYIFENFEITGTVSPLTNRGIFCVANNLVVRHCVVHDCPRHGILGADQFSGNVTLEHLEVYHCGSSDRFHQIYMATDNFRFPNATVRIQFCYIHDGTGGNNIKSRAARNEIYYNWVEGAFYHELELIGADLEGQHDSVTVQTVREDSDVVGNVLRKVDTSSGALARLGSDGTGDSYGRFRLVNNTMIMGGAGSSAIRLFEHLETLEMFNNVIWRPSGTATTVIRTVEQLGSVAHAGISNWIPSNGTGVPSAWTGTRTGSTPNLSNPATFDFTPAPGSILINNSLLPTVSPSGLPFPNPLGSPVFTPKRAYTPQGAQMARPVQGPVDIGAIEMPSTAGISEWLEFR